MDETRVAQLREQLCEHLEIGPDCTDIALAHMAIQQNGEISTLGQQLLKACNSGAQNTAFLSACEAYQDR
jgi:hypothetical protein